MNAAPSLAGRQAGKPCPVGAVSGQGHARRVVRMQAFPSIAVLDEFRKLLAEREQELAQLLRPTNYLGNVY